MTGDETNHTRWRWQPFWSGLPRFPVEHVITVDQFGLWRQHLMWSKRSGEELRGILTQRLASNVVFLTLLVSSEIGILFSPSEPARLVRKDLRDADYTVVEFYAGLFLCFAILAAIAALYASFTAWSIIYVISNENIHALLRSSLGLYGAQLPSRMIVMAIYLFFIQVSLFLFVIMPHYWAFILTSLGTFLLIHISSTYSAFGRVITYTGAMGTERVFTRQEAEHMVPYELYEELLDRVQEAKRARIPVNRQYRMAYWSSLGRPTREVPPGDSNSNTDINENEEEPDIESDRREDPSNDDKEE